MLLPPHDYAPAPPWKSSVGSACSSHTVHACHLPSDSDTCQKGFRWLQKHGWHQSRGFQEHPQGHPLTKEGQSWDINSPPSSPFNRTAVRNFCAVSQSPDIGSEPHNGNWLMNIPFHLLPSFLPHYAAWDHVTQIKHCTQIPGSESVLKKPNCNRDRNFSY